MMTIGGIFKMMDESLLCDFCNRSVVPGSQFTVIGNPVEMMIASPGMEGEIGHSASWCACEHCHRLISLGAWEVLIRYVMASLCVPGQSEDIPLELILRATYSKAFGQDLLSMPASFYTASSPAL